MTYQTFMLHMPPLLPAKCSDLLIPFPCRQICISHLHSFFLEQLPHLWLDQIQADLGIIFLQKSTVSKLDVSNYRPRKFPTFLEDGGLLEVCEGGDG